MNAERLLQHFERIAEAPDAIPRLRRFILDLAVRGKLVQQDPNDEPAEALLQLIPKGGITPTVPSGWISGVFGNLFEMQYGKGLSAKDRNEQGEVPAFGSNGVVGYTDTALTDKPAIIIGRKGSAGALNLCDGPSWTTDVAYFLVPPTYFDIRFLLFTLETLDLATLGKGVKPGLSRSDAYQLPIAIPPLAEQHRIVAKVDELMALCDQLEAAKTEREQSRDRLVAASLHRLNSPADTAENRVPDLPVEQADTFRDHALFVFKNLPRLTSHPTHIKLLRQTILDLAARGKLVPQDPNDEPAAELLKRIETEKIQLIEQGTIKRQLPVVPLKVDEFLSGVPDSWKWVRLRDLLLRDSQNGYSKKPDDALNGIPILRISAGTLRKDGIVAEEEHKLIGGVSASQQKQYQLQPGDLLACGFNGNRGFVGHLSLYTGYLGIKPIYPDKLIRLRLLSPFVLPKLVMYFAESNDVRKDIESYCATTVGNWGISASNLKEVKIPLPPLAEQHRIVAKVDELTALCDQLEAQVTAAEANGRRLLEAVLHEALNPLAEVAAQLEQVADRVNAPQN